MSILEVEWRSNDPALKRVFATIREEKDQTIRWELEAVLHRFEADRLIRLAGEARGRRNAYRHTRRKDNEDG